MRPQNRSRSGSNKSSLSSPRRQRINRQRSNQIDQKNHSPDMERKYKGGRSPSEQARRDYKKTNIRSPRKQRQNQEPVPQNNKLFVTNIQGKFPQNEVRQDLKKEFQVFGKIIEIVVKTKPNSSNTYAFIQYQKLQDSIKAQAEMSMKKFKGKQLKVQFGRITPRIRDNREGRYCTYCNRSGHITRDCRQKMRIDRQRYHDYDIKRRKSNSRDRYPHRYRRSYSRSRSSSQNYRYRKRSRSRSPIYNDRRPYQRYDRYERYGRYEKQQRGRYDRQERSRYERYRYQRDLRDRQRYNREPRQGRHGNQEHQKRKNRSP